MSLSPVPHSKRIPGKRVLAIAASAALFALAGCGKQEEAPKPAEAPQAAAPAGVTVKIGHAAPLTGGIAHLGKDNENGVRLAIDEANARGLTIGGAKITF